MSRSRQQPLTRGRPVALPVWWIAELKHFVDDRLAAVSGGITQLAADLSATQVARDRGAPFRREDVHRFVSDTVRTEPLMLAFLELFPTLLPPVFSARTRDEAQKLWEVARQHDDPILPVFSARTRDEAQKLQEVARQYDDPDIERN